MSSDGVSIFFAAGQRTLCLAESRTVKWISLLVVVIFNHGTFVGHDRIALEGFGQRPTQRARLALFARGPASWSWRSWRSWRSRRTSAIWTWRAKSRAHGSWRRTTEAGHGRAHARLTRSTAAGTAHGTRRSAGSAGRSTPLAACKARDSPFELVEDVRGQLPKAIERQCRELLAGLIALWVESVLGEQEARHIGHTLQALVLAAHQFIEDIRTEFHELRHTKPQQLVPSPVRLDVSLLIAQARGQILLQHHVVFVQRGLVLGLEHWTSGRGRASIAASSRRAGGRRRALATAHTAVGGGSRHVCRTAGVLGAGWRSRTAWAWRRTRSAVGRAIVVVWSSAIAWRGCRDRTGTAHIAVA